MKYKRNKIGTINKLSTKVKINLIEYNLTLILDPKIKTGINHLNILSIQLILFNQV